MNRSLPMIRLPDDLADKVEAAAAADKRTVSDWVRLLLARELSDTPDPIPSGLGDTGD